MNKILRYHIIVILVFSLFVFSLPTNAYKVESGTEVHQHITNESQNVWKLVFYEIKENLAGSSLSSGKNNANYNNGDNN